MKANKPAEHDSTSKKWKEYLLEFFMLFLAVALGFLSDNFREHFSDKSKEKQYIASFVRNVKDDTTNLNHVIKFYKRQLGGVDSMLALSHSDMNAAANRKLFYHLSNQYLYSKATFKSNDATLQQLKSTGDYRLIGVVDSLTKYDAEIQNIYRQGTYYENYFNEILSRLDEITDMRVFADTSFVKNGVLTNKPFPKLRDDNGKLHTLFNKIYVFRSIINSYREDLLIPQLKRSEGLIMSLEEEYDLKNEN